MNKGGNISKKFFSYAFIALISMTTLLGFSQVLPAQEKPDVSSQITVPLSPELSDEEALFARAAQFGSVRVIVGFDVGFQPEGALLSEAQVENQRLAIDIAQDVVLNSLESHDVRNVKRFSYIPYMALEVDEAALDALWRNPNIVSIHEDLPLPPVLADSVPLINADDVWNRLPEGFDGTGMAVAILDTGVRKSHEFLDGGKVVSEACYSTTDSYYDSKTVCPNGKQSQTGSAAGKNCSTNWDGCSHGTHVAGIAAGTGGVGGLEGVAKGADIIAIQVFSKFTGGICTANGYSSPCVFSFISDQVKGLERVYALRNKYNIAAINISIGGGRYTEPCNSEPQAAIIKNLRSVGIATVIASGNDSDTDALASPACISAAISVGATEKDDDVAYFSNSAYFLNLLAPGVSIRSSIADTSTSYQNKDGTSMAAPHVAGAFALLRQANFDASVKDIRNALQNTGVDVADYRNGRIKPRIDVEAALAELGVVRPEITTPVTGEEIDTSTVEFQWTSNGAAVQKWELSVGTAPGQNNVYDGPKVDAGFTTQTVDCIPLIGDPVYARLRFKIREKWWFIDFQYSTAISSSMPAITNPLPDTTLSDNQQAFDWNAGDFCVDAWKLFVGTSPGAKDLYESGKLAGSVASQTVNGLPFDGSTLYVRLKYKIAGAWQYTDYQYTAVTWNIGITSVVPATGSQLDSRDVTFTWEEDTNGKLTKWRLWIGSGAGMNDYYDSGGLPFDTLDQTVTKLPKDGRPLYVRLRFKINGLWEYADYQYTAVDTLPKITDPLPGSTLSGYTVTFTWTNAGHDVQKWRLYIGSAVGLNDYYDSGGLDAVATGVTCNVVPTDGSKIHVQLRYKENDKWKYRDYQYTAANLVPAIFDPVNGSPLEDTSQLFQWQDNNAYIRKYKLWVGSSLGANDIYDSGNLPGTELSHTATGLPFNGSMVYVRHRYKSGVTWKHMDYQYTAVDTAPEITSPTPNSTFVHSTVTFEWQSDITVEKYRLWVGKKLGESNVYDSGNLDGGAAPHTKSHIAHKLLINGKKLYVRLRFKVGGDWYYRDYEYTAVTWNFMLTDPAPGSKLPGKTDTFFWTDNGAPVNEWKLKIGTNKGGNDIHTSGWLQPDTTSDYVTGIPTGGSKIYARLYARFDDDVHFKDYTYKTNFVSHRFFNNLLCGSSKFTAKVSICGKSVSSTSGKWSSCVKTKSGTCKGTIYADAGACGIFEDSASFNLQLGCHYDWVLDVYGGEPVVWFLKTCPGDCSTPKPLSVSGVLSDPAAVDSIEVIMRIPVEGDFNTIE